jgi:hypothetical protein
LDISRVEGLHFEGREESERKDPDMSLMATVATFSGTSADIGGSCTASMITNASSGGSNNALDAKGSSVSPTIGRTLPAPVFNTPDEDG